MRLVMMVTIAAFLTGCGPSSAPPQAQRTIKVQGEEQKHIAGASDLNRAIALKRAIHDSGSLCKRVTATRFIRDYKNMAMWQANCDDDRSWAVFIAAEGSIQVRPCTDLKELKLPECLILKETTAGTKPAA